VNLSLGHPRTPGFSVNGAPAPLPSPPTVGALVAVMAGSVGGRGIAVAVNGEVVPRSAWDDTGLEPGDRVEVLTAAQGG
jgi:sulfur carrier protein